MNAKDEIAEALGIGPFRVICIDNDPLTDLDTSAVKRKLTLGKIYTVLETHNRKLVGFPSYVIVNDLGEKSEYGTARFQVYIPENG